MINTAHEENRFSRRRIRLATLTNTRWLAVLGQSAVLAIVNGYLEFPLPVTPCVVLIAVSVVVNIYITWRYPANQRLASKNAFLVLIYDVVQLAALLYLTGGLTNPFAILLMVPAIISAATLPFRFTAALSVLVVFAATVLALQHYPLPWYEGQTLAMPLIFVLGMWGSLVSGLLFATFYVYRVASEARRLSDALAATELVIQREQHLSDLDGMAAAAAHELGTPLATISLVAKEMDHAVGETSSLKEDIILLRGQADRCRDILGRLNTLGTDEEGPISRVPLTVMMEDIIAPHREFGVEIITEMDEQVGDEPIELRDSGFVYGLGNMVENAVDFARTEVRVIIGWDERNISIRIEDDGPGFQSEQLALLGEPEIGNVRGAERSRKGSSGLGLGIFIAKTLMERNGAQVSFANSANPGVGAVVTTVWPRQSVSR